MYIVFVYNYSRSEIIAPRKLKIYKIENIMTLEQYEHYENLILDSIVWFNRPNTFLCLLC